MFIYKPYLETFFSVKMGFSAIDNFKRFASSKPPLMVFMICLGFFAVILLSLAYYVKTQEMTNPDISQVSTVQGLYVVCYYWFNNV